MRKYDDKRSAGGKLAYAVVWGAGIGFLIVLLLFCLLSIVIISGKIPESLMPHLTAISALLGSFAGGVTAVRLHRSRLVVVGLSVGALMFILTLVVALVSVGKAVGSLTLIHLLMLLIGSVAGSLMNLKRKTRRHS